MNKKYILLLFLCALLINKSFAQVSADPLTGSANVNIPIYTIRSGQVALPISISYNSSGVRPKDVEGTVGMNWQLNAGGQVSRQVRGLPDDCTKDNASPGNQRLGWMSSLDSGRTNINGFLIENNGVNCSFETNDISDIIAKFPFRNDTEPDMFYVSAPGLSCQMFYDGSNFKLVNYQDLVVSYTTDPTSHLITSFTIKNDKGITYSFSDYEIVTETTNAASPSYFTNKYQQYRNGITYYDSWSLTSITDANGNSINLTYNYPANPRPSTDSVVFFGSGGSPYLRQYYINKSVLPPTVHTIDVSYGSSATVFNFTWTTSSTGQPIISSITGMGRDFEFVYSPVKYTPTNYFRSFLRNFYDNGCSTPVNYKFGYVGETVGSPYYTTVLPDSASNKTDYWGYYSTSPGSNLSQIPSVYVNPSDTSYQRYVIGANNSPGSSYSYNLVNTNRKPDTANVRVGSLNKIIYANGGNSNIKYESNDYYDVPAGLATQGGGIRVKQIIDSVGTLSTNNIIRNYSYLNPSTGVSSGKPISLPQYATTLPYSGTNTGLALWQSATILSAHDLSTEDHTIMYEYAKVSQSGAGSTVYQYYVPASYWDHTAKGACSGCSTDWNPAIDYIARTNCVLTYGPVRNNFYSYPFVPNPNYDFERGLPIKVTSYNDAGSEVSESNYTYQRSYTPTIIYAFKFDDLPNGTLLVKAYNKYKINYTTSELTAKVVNKVYDSQGLSQVHADSVTYTYGSANHKLVTQEQATNSDGSSINTNINYVKDYTATAGSNPNITSIHSLQVQNINVPVETYQQTNRGGTAKTTSASLTLFRDTTISSVVHSLVSRQFKWIQPDGGTFTPMTISGTTLTKDAGYFGTANYDIYNNTGFPETVDDNYKHIQTTIINRLVNQPIAVFSNAAYNQVAYSDFDGDVSSPDYAFSISGSGFTAVGSHAGHAYGLTATSQTVSHTVSKNPVASNYIFSIWINAASGTNTLNISLNGGTAVPYTYTGTGAWKYYEWKISVSGMPSSFSFSFTSAQNISVDDILLYPDVAQASTATYDPTTFNKLDATNTNGVSAYYTSDQWGRLLYTFDQDKNIVQKNTFITPADIASFNAAALYGGATNNTPTTFGISGPNDCSMAGAKVTWNFGDGTIVTSTGLTSPSHTFHKPYADTVTATINSPLLGQKILTLHITVTPLSIPITYFTGATSHGDISAVTFTPIGPGTSYSFTKLTLDGGHVNQGKYTVAITLFDGQQYNSMTGAGYTCVVMYVDSTTIIACSNFVTGNNYSFVVDISNNSALGFWVSKAIDCAHFNLP